MDGRLGGYPRGGWSGTLRRVALPAVLAAACLLALAACGCSTTSAPPAVGTETGSSVTNSDADFARAFADHANGVLLEGRGTVVNVLADDTEGSRHQRFIVRLDSGQTLLVAHNIDVAPRVRGLKVGDAVSFKGEYEWNSQGGVMHWTHHDPDGTHPPGWIEHGGRVYQ